MFYMIDFIEIYPGDWLDLIKLFQLSVFAPPLLDCVWPMSNFTRYNVSNCARVTET